MTRQELEHIIRAAADVTNEKELKKDLRYTGHLWEYAMLDSKTLAERLRNTDLKATDKPRNWIEATVARQRRRH